MGHVVQWTAPAPLWSSAVDNDGATAARAIQRPALLRFASDTFMDEFLARMAHDPGSMDQLLARWETWRTPAAPPEPVKQLPLFERPLVRHQLAVQRSANLPTSVPADDPKPLKLYQPAHQRFYLLTACLVCQAAGLPDRTIQTGERERAGFVIRRLLPKGFDPATFDSKVPLPVPLPDQSSRQDFDEYALVLEDKRPAWQKLSDPKQLAVDEERLALFPVHYTQDDGHPRRILAGLVPVAKRESYLAAPLKDGGSQPTGGDAQSLASSDSRVGLLRAQVIEPWQRQIEGAHTANSVLSSIITAADPKVSPDKTRREARQDAQTVSWFLLLDLANFLHDHVKDVFDGVMDTTKGSALTGAPGDLFKALQGTTISTASGQLAEALANSKYQKSQVATSLDQALRLIVGGAPYTEQKARDLTNKIEAIPVAYDREAPDPGWPAFLFPLVDLDFPDLGGPLPPHPTGVSDVSDPLQAAIDRIDYFANTVVAAMPASTAPELLPPVPLAAATMMNPNVPGWFVIRCVFERPLCDPRLSPAVLSDPSLVFHMAGFFDPDAPARPVRIALPVDVSPAGLRKFDKNTAFMLSDMLCGHMKRARAMTLGDLVLSVLPFPFHKDLPDAGGAPCTDKGGLEIGMICSLSIPIITICALILLMIIVNLLNIIFHWLPFFIACFPLPKFRGKGST